MNQGHRSLIENLSLKNDRISSPLWGSTKVVIRFLFQDLTMDKAMGTETPPTIEIDACGLTCPLPLLKAKQALNKMNSGEILEIWATDPGSVRDFEVFAEQSGHVLIQSNEISGKYQYLIKRK